MEHLAQLAALVESLRVVDGYQYVATSLAPTLPSDIRIIIRRRPASRLGSAIHDQYTLAMALRGSAWVVLDRHRIRLQEGQALLIHPGQQHGYEDVAPTDVFWLFCGFHQVGSAEWTSLRSQPLTMSPRFSADIGALLGDHFTGAGHGKRHTPQNDLMVALRLRLALEQLQAQAMAAPEARPDAPEASPGDTSHPLIQRVLRHVREHLPERLSISGIAAALDLSPGQLRNAFRSLSGTTIGSYIRHARLRQACILMDTTDLPLAEIGRRCGYESTFSFSRAFKDDKGIPPSTYRSTFKPVR